ncbi:hypothetical protein DT065_07120 [Salicibibacter kimchii]|uniref:Uncharacterized protein n=1 Tax=Salicibibacter kimchii TaxID=2099786 RepID=A0A345BXZ0_9BACI|nr:hypothetical protein DT065_07120 [Salicibibacter kimchii]
MRYKRQASSMKKWGSSKRFLISSYSENTNEFPERSCKKCEKQNQNMSYPIVFVIECKMPVNTDKSMLTGIYEIFYLNSN